MRKYLSSTWNKVAVGAVLLSALAFGGVHAYNYVSGDCCAQQSACCETGCPLCAGHGHHVAQR
ncbi:MAG: hypothetical protein IPK60_06010 [Sandaracinaceae bacterium]|nr:hypothetical protein [Sandaracinaceae bacterium]